MDIIFRRIRISCDISMYQDKKKPALFAGTFESRALFMIQM